MIIAPFDHPAAEQHIVATVDFPTPPLPLATAITCWTPGRRFF